MHDGFQITVATLDPNNPDNLPLMVIDRLHAISGRNPCGFKGQENVIFTNSLCETFTNYCVGSTQGTPNAGVLTGAVCASASNNATHACLGSGGTTQAGYGKRTVTLSNGAGTCAATGTASVSSYSTATKILTVTGTSWGSNIPDPNCNYSIAAPPNSIIAPCSEDWITNNSANWDGSALFINENNATPSVNGQFLGSNLTLLSYLNNGVDAGAGASIFIKGHDNLRATFSHITG